MPPWESLSRKHTQFLERHFGGSSDAAQETTTGDDSRGPLGLTVLHEPQEPQIDFIFVHGLRGGSRKTWSKTGALRHFWPREWLPVEPRLKNVRISSFGYNSDWRANKVSAVNVHDFGQALLGEIHNSPYICASGTETPIVLIGHSMGGVVIKKTFLLARQDPIYIKLVARFHSMFFLATPHRGADSAQLLSNLLRLSLSHTTKTYVGDLVPDSGVTQVINDQFRHFYAALQLWSFFETVETSVGLIVPKDSAILGVPGERVQLLNADHRHVCKFEDPSDNNYRTILNAFISTVDSIEKTQFSTQRDERYTRIRLLSQYLAISGRPDADLAIVTERKVEGSCEWLTNSATYISWRRESLSTEKCFWLAGDPAMGKSTIAGHVIKDLETAREQCAYFFFKDGDAKKSNIATMLRSLVWQMAESNAEICQIVLEMERAGELVDHTDPRAIWRTVFATRILQVKLQRPFYWILDGLDECSNHESLFPLLAKVAPSFPLKLFFTSRPSLIIERLLSQEKIGRVKESISRQTSQSDIKLFLEANSRYFPVDCEEERKELIDQILDKSNGNFLWTSLVLKELETVHGKQQIQEVLKSIPHEMDGLYIRILPGLAKDSRNKALARVVLKWTLCAIRPLDVEELKEAIRLDIGEIPSRLEKIAGELCGNLIHVDHQSRIQVTHQTVRDFLFTSKVVAEFAFDKQKEHTQLSEVCLNYLCGDEMKTNRYRRGSVGSRPFQRSAFANYAMVHFADHLARSTSSSNPQATALDLFLRSNSLTWIELLARSGDLKPVVQAAKSLKIYLERRAKYCSPLDQEIRNITAWSRDLVQLMARFGTALLTHPFAIHFVIPPVCPSESIIFETYSTYPRPLQMTGLSEPDWNDRLRCVTYHDAQALSITCRDHRVAIGWSDGMVRIYQITTFEQDMVLGHNEPVRSLQFGTVVTSLASAGRTKITLWNVTSGARLRTIQMRDQILALDFDMDNSLLMVATKANILSYFDVADGLEVDTLQFSDIADDQPLGPRYARSPTHTAFSIDLNLLAVTYRQRPISVWDLEDGTFVGQFHKNDGGYPGPLIFALIFNLNPGLSLAAAAYDDGDVVTFDPWTQKQHAAKNAEAVTLASSSDGTILATGNSTGTITLYEFETLVMLYQLSSFEQTIRSIVFNSYGSGFLDIRDCYCNVWEPSVLVRRRDVGDSSSMDISEQVSSGPQYGSTRSFDDDRAITTVAMHQGGEKLFCGREDGTVAVYATSTGAVGNELFNHAKNVAVLLISWSPANNLLASVGRSGRLIVQKLLVRESSMVISRTVILDKKSVDVTLQLLIDPNGERLLNASSQMVELWNLEDSTLVCTQSINSHIEPVRWVSHPSNRNELLLIKQTSVQRFDWRTLSELSGPETIELGFDLRSSQILASMSDGVLAMSFTGSRTENEAPSLVIWPTRSSSQITEMSERRLNYGKLARAVKRVIGYYRSSLIFLTHTGWICSIGVKDQKERQAYYIRHFFVPFQFHSTEDDMTVLVTPKGSVVITYVDELLIFHSGLDFEEPVELETRATSPRPTMTRHNMRRTSSNTTRSIQAVSRPTMVGAARNSFRSSESLDVPNFNEDIFDKSAESS